MGAWPDSVRRDAPETRFGFSDVAGRVPDSLDRKHRVLATVRAVTWRRIGAVVAGYACGLLPSAQLVARLVAEGTDPTRDGSGNPGTANIAQLVGKQAAAIVLAADAGKGVVAGRLGHRLAGDVGLHAASTASLVGHCFPITRPGRGGKGVATSIGQVLVSFPSYFPIDAAVAGVTYYAAPFRRDARAATMTASVVWVVAGLAWWRRRWPNLWGPPPSGALAAASTISALTIAFRFEQAARQAPPSNPADPPAEDSSP